MSREFPETWQTIDNRDAAKRGLVNHEPLIMTNPDISNAGL